MEKIAYICSKCGEVESFNPGTCPLCGGKFIYQLATLSVQNDKPLNITRLPMELDRYNWYVSKMKRYAENDDGESAHIDADSLLTDFLEELGCEELVNAFYNVKRWYS